MPSTLRVELQLRIVSDDDTVIRDEVILQLDKSDDRLEAVGLCLEESKDLLGRLQHAVVEAQAAAYVNRHRRCSACGRRLRGKGQYPIVFRTGGVRLRPSRWCKLGDGHQHRRSGRGQRGKGRFITGGHTGHRFQRQVTVL